MFRFTGSVQSCCGEGGGAADRHRSVWGALAVFWPRWVCPAHGCVLSRLHCSGSRLLYMERPLRGMRFQFSGTPQKRGLGWTCVLCLPRPSSSGRQELAGRALPAAARLLPSAAPASVSTSRVPAPCVCSGELASSRDPPGRCQPSRISGSLWLEAGNLFSVW